MQSASTEQDDGHDVLLPLHTYGAHEGLPEDPANASMHVPTEPETLQAWHAAPQAVLQQTPSTH
jgi:hypothetical protein